ncbi:SNF2 family N-terminal domain-containing protein [Hypoxylon sp. FL0543]|nr:SNF2 family N-terminal domain-containing protein [Hypoxylon sp. FL0543]
MKLKTPTEKLTADLWLLEIKLENLRGALDTPEARANLESQIKETKHRLELAKSESHEGDQRYPKNLTSPDVINSTGKLAENSQQDADAPEAKKRTFSEHIGSFQDSEVPVPKSRRIMGSPLSAPEAASSTLSNLDVLSDVSKDDKPESSTQPSSLGNSPCQGPSPNSIQTGATKRDEFIQVDEDEIPITVNKSHIKNVFIDVQENSSAEDEKKLLEVLKYPLYKHQKIAVEWMKTMEMNETKRGGILGDDMGLGKTLSMIALMLSRKAKPSSDAKTNLIVAPLSLLKQWEREIEEKILPEHRLRVWVQHGDRKTNYDFIRTYDVVLTTYHCLTSELKKLDTYVQECTDRGVIVDNDQLDELCPLLGPNSLFLRVILDESQCIKNHKTLSAKAVSKLQANYRWCLSGTPMQNTPMELGSLVHFLRIEPYCDLALFRNTFRALHNGRMDYSRARALERLHALLKAICLRRTKSSKIDEEPIVQLKQKIEIVDHAVFSADEDQFYQDLQKDTCVTYKGYRSGAVKVKFAKIFVLLLRLRQACCHPLLNIKDLEIVESNSLDGSSDAAARSLPHHIVERTKIEKAFQCSICNEAVTKPAIMYPCGDYFCAPCIKDWSIQADGDQGEVKCPACKTPNDGKFVDYDTFKKVHMQDTVEDDDLYASEKVHTQETANGENYDDLGGSNNDSSDEDEVDNNGNLKNFVVDDDVEERDNESPQGKPKSKARNKSKSKEKTKEKFQPEMLIKLRKDAGNNKRAHKRYMRALRNIALPSAKIAKCCEIISGIQETTQEKIIVFSEWTLLLDILQLAIKDQLNMSVYRYNGGMTKTERDNTILKFTNNPDVKIILISIAAGNSGLNLTAASQVIFMHPVWNPYMEKQAIDRAYRIGQQKDVTVHRILIKGTIEDRIMQIQDRKRNDVEAALGEEAQAKINSLSEDDVAFLFGVGQRP